MQEIFSFLNNIRSKDFQQLFDFEELNKEGIYPYDVWNNETGNEFAFNVRHMTEQFIELKILFEQAAKEEDYVLSFVG